MGYCSRSVLYLGAFCGVLNAQGSAKIDFQRDVQPILRANCIGCHGPTQQMNNFRLDRRRDALRGGTIAVIAPGSSQSSHMYLRLTGHDTMGMPMPPTGALPAGQIETIGKWIDQGAEWPDAASGEKAPPPPDAKATALMSTLRSGDRQAFQKLLREDPKVAKAKGPGGSTALMYATLYGDADAVKGLLEAGADANAHNDTGATALMWAVPDLEKARLLVTHGADVNARSDDGRTPLLIASRLSGGRDVVKLLLDGGANPSVKASSLLGDVTPLSQAMYAADEPVFRLLLEHGADRKTAGVLGLTFAYRARCNKCADEMIGTAGMDVLTQTSFFVSPPLGPGIAATALLSRGVDVKAKGPDGLSLLMSTSGSGSVPLETVRTLIDKGADVNDKAPDGQTALDFARRQGQTPVVDLLLKSGAKPGTMALYSPAEAKPAASVRAAVERSVPLLQRTDATFLKKAGCISCHNNSLTAIAVAAARKQGVHVNEESVQRQVKTIGNYIETWRERSLQGVGIPGDADTVSYLLLGLAAENFPADPATDAMAYFVKNQQLSDGHWVTFAQRPPIESSDIQVTAISLRALQIYGIKSQRAAYEKSMQSAAAWLEKAEPRDTQDGALRLVAMHWAGAGKEKIQAAAAALMKEQRPDGGWAQTATLASDAYATGQALWALQESGALKSLDPVCQRASQFLVKTQLADGSWYVHSRAVPLQPYFESDFPHGHDQWISAAGTGWATKALAMMTP